MRIMTRFLVAFFTFVLSSIAGAENNARPIDIAECMEKDCFARDVHVFIPEENIEVQAWFDVVTFDHNPKLLFFPLFNVYNRTQSPIEVSIGMLLLDKDKSKLLEIIGIKAFNPTETTEPNSDTFLSINAEPLTVEIIRNTKYLRVMYRRQ
jgi:hypothetical protein